MSELSEQDDHFKGRQKCAQAIKMVQQERILITDTLPQHQQIKEEYFSPEKYVKQQQTINMLNG